MKKTSKIFLMITIFVICSCLLCACSLGGKHEDTNPESPNPGENTSPEIEETKPVDDLAKYFNKNMKTIVSKYENNVVFKDYAKLYSESVVLDKESYLNMHPSNIDPDTERLSRAIFGTSFDVQIIAVNANNLPSKYANVQADINGPIAICPDIIYCEQPNSFLLESKLENLLGKSNIKDNFIFFKPNLLSFELCENIEEKDGIVLDKSGEILLNVTKNTVNIPSSVKTVADLSLAGTKEVFIPRDVKKISGNAFGENNNIVVKTDATPFDKSPEWDVNLDAMDIEYAVENPETNTPDVNPDTSIIDPNNCTHEFGEWQILSGCESLNNSFKYRQCSNCYGYEIVGTKPSSPNKKAKDFYVSDDLYLIHNEIMYSIKAADSVKFESTYNNSSMLTFFDLNGTYAFYDDTKKQGYEYQLYGIDTVLDLYKAPGLNTKSTVRVETMNEMLSVEYYLEKFDIFNIIGQTTPDNFDGDHFEFTYNGSRFIVYLTKKEIRIKQITTINNTDFIYNYRIFDLDVSIDIDIPEGIHKQARIEQPKPENPDDGIDGELLEINLINIPDRDLTDEYKLKYGKCKKHRFVEYIVNDSPTDNLDLKINYCPKCGLMKPTFNFKLFDISTSNYNINTKENLGPQLMKKIDDNKINVIRCDNFEVVFNKSFAYWEDLHTYGNYLFFGNGNNINLYYNERRDIAIKVPEYNYQYFIDKLFKGLFFDVIINHAEIGVPIVTEEGLHIDVADYVLNKPFTENDIYYDPQLNYDIYNQDGISSVDIHGSISVTKNGNTKKYRIGTSFINAPDFINDKLNYIKNQLFKCDSVFLESMPAIKLEPYGEKVIMDATATHDGLKLTRNRKRTILEQIKKVDRGYSDKLYDINSSNYYKDILNKLKDADSFKYTILYPDYPEMNKSIYISPFTCSIYSLDEALIPYEGKILHSSEKYLIDGGLCDINSDSIGQGIVYVNCKPITFRSSNMFNLLFLKLNNIEEILNYCSTNHPLENDVTVKAFPVLNYAFNKLRYNGWNLNISITDETLSISYTGDNFPFTITIENVNNASIPKSFLTTFDPDAYNTKDIEEILCDSITIEETISEYQGVQSKYNYLVFKNIFGESLFGAELWRNNYQYCYYDELPFTFTPIDSICGDLGVAVYTFKFFGKEYSYKGEFIGYGQHRYNYEIIKMPDFNVDHFLETTPGMNSGQFKKVCAQCGKEIIYDLPLFDDPSYTFYYDNQDGISYGQMCDVHVNLNNDEYMPLEFKIQARAEHLYGTCEIRKEGNDFVLESICSNCLEKFIVNVPEPSVDNPVYSNIEFHDATCIHKSSMTGQVKIGNRKYKFCYSYGTINENNHTYQIDEYNLDTNIPIPKLSLTCICCNHTINVDLPRNPEFYKINHKIQDASCTYTWDVYDVNIYIESLDKWLYCPKFKVMNHENLHLMCEDQLVEPTIDKEGLLICYCHYCGETISYKILPPSERDKWDEKYELIYYEEPTKFKDGTIAYDFNVKDISRRFWISIPYVEK